MELDKKYKKTEKETVVIDSVAKKDECDIGPRAANNVVTGAYSSAVP